MLEVANLRINYQDKSDNYEYDFSFRINEAQINVLLGPTGSGKSTLLNALAGVIKTSSGKFFFDGTRLDNLPPAKRPFISMFQEQNLILHLDLQTNITLGLPKIIAKDTNLLAYLSELLTVTNLSEFKKSLASNLSGGQKQLVALIRCLLIANFKKFPNFKNRLILLDEPFNGLDVNTKNKVLELISLELKTKKISFLLSTHDLTIAKKIADQVWQIDSSLTKVGIKKKIF
ncbi:MAG: ATP-binding cassette domain-containing protein [SAR324 cluster bacterium]|nr:ATP-binding cassette domain-containing protein [SAR324 cluster bacterium]